MNETTRILSGETVYLSDPDIGSMDEFLRMAKNSYQLHDPWVKPPSDESEYIEYINRVHKENQSGFFIRLNTSNDLIGVINLNEIVRGGFQSAYLGFYAFSGYEGRGLMSEGLKLVIEYVFEHLNLHRLEANIQGTNVKSISFIRRHHFRHEGFSPNYLKINNEWKDHERFAITLEDYTKSQLKIIG